jgi:O-acetylserine/cysteine efflux transporter
MASAALLLAQIPTIAEAVGGALLVTGVLVSGMRSPRSRRGIAAGAERSAPAVCGTELSLSAGTGDPDARKSAAVADAVRGSG